MRRKYQAGAKSETGAQELAQSKAQRSDSTRQHVWPVARTHLICWASALQDSGRSETARAESSGNLTVVSLKNVAHADAVP